MSRTSFPWLPLFLFALAVCCLIAYAREQDREDAEWQSVMDAIPRQMEAAR